MESAIKARTSKQIRDNAPFSQPQFLKWESRFAKQALAKIDKISFLTFPQLNICVHFNWAGLSQLNVLPVW